MLTAAKGSRHTSRRDSEINLTIDMSLSSLLAGGGGACGGVGPGVGGKSKQERRVFERYCQADVCRAGRSDMLY